MAGCLDKCTCPDWEIWNVVKERRNFIASVTGGAMFSIGWWIIIDAAVMYPKQTDFHHACHTIGVFATLALFMINSVSNSALRGDNYVEGCFGQTGSRVWFFIGFILSFGSLIAASGVLFGVYVVPVVVSVVAAHTAALQHAKQLHSTPAKLVIICYSYIMLSCIILKHDCDDCAVVTCKQPIWAGIALFLQNALIFFGGLIFKFGRTEEQWG